MTLCGSSPVSFPHTIRVCRPAPLEIRQTICEGDTYRAPNGQIFSYNDAFPAGSNIPIILDPVNAGTPPCPRRDLLFLEAAPPSFSSETVVLCGNEPFTGCTNPDPPVTTDTTTQYPSCLTPPAAGQPCSTTTFFTVIRLKPVAEISGPTTIPCGSTAGVTLSATPGSSASQGTRVVTYRWDRGAGTPVLGTGATVTAPGPGLYRLVVSMTDTRDTDTPRKVCTAETTVTIVGGSVTPPAPMLTAPSTVCANAAPINVTIAGPQPGTTYQWELRNTAATGAPTANTTGYTIASLNGASAVEVCARVAGAGGSGGCPPSAYTCRTITVTPPTPAITLTGPADLCSGATGTYTIAPYDPSLGAYAVTTTGSGTTVALNGASVTVTMGATGSEVCVTLTPPASNSCGTPRSACAQIAVGSAPVAPTPSGPATACVGDADTYTISPAPAAATTVTWRADGGTVSGTGATRTVTWATPGANQVCVRVENGCGNDEECFPVVVQAAVTATISGGGAYCAGGTPPGFTIAFAGGSPPFQYTYTGGGAPVTGTASAASVTIAPTGPGTYTLTAVSSGGCPGTFAGSAVVTENPTPAASIGGAATLCPGGTGTLQVILTGGTGPWTFTPTLNGAPLAPVTATSSPYTYTVTQPGTYAIASVSTGSAPDLCVGAGTGSAAVTEVAPLVVGTPSYACAGNSLTYTATLSIAGGVAPYTVTPAGGAAVTQAAAGDFVSGPINSGDQVTYTIRDASGCATNVQTRTATNSCDCPAEVGTLQVAPGLSFCQTSEVADAAALYDAGGEVAPAPYVRRYVLSTGTNPVSGIVATNATGRFGFAAPMTTGTTYYVTVVVGIPDAQGNFDYSNACTRVSGSLPVVWRQAPSATLAGGAEVCPDATADLTIAIAGGSAPWTVILTRDGQPLPAITVTGSPYTYAASAAGTYAIAGVTAGGCTGAGAGTAVVTVTAAMTVGAFGAYACSANGATFTGSVAVAGGRAPYTITGPGGASTLAAAGSFTTGDLASGTSASYTIADASGCFTETVTAAFTCDCPTAVGTLTVAPGLSFCGTADVAPGGTRYDATPENAPAPYVRRFVLSTGINPVTGVIASNATGDFGFGAGMTAGTTYYISAVVGIPDARGNFDYSDACTRVSAGLPVVWRTPPTAAIGAGSSICQGATGVVDVTVTGTGSLTVTYTVDGGAPQTVQVTAPAGTIQLPNLRADATVALVSVAGANCTNAAAGSAVITVNEPVVATLTDEVCSQDKTTYTVTVALSGGEATSYTVSPAGAGTIAQNGFTSAPIPEGQGYAFTFTDANGCDPVTVDGSFACDCETDAGTMPATLVQVCGDAGVTVTPTAPASPDANDVAVYYLHTGSPTTLGTVLAGPQATATFAFVPGVTAYGTTYFISVAVGNDVGGAPDPTDRCYDVAGTPVRWNEPPTATIGAGSAVCAGAEGRVSVALTGTGPWVLTYTIDGGAAQTLTATASPATIVLPVVDATTAIALTGVSTGSGATLCAAPASGSATVAALPALTATATPECDATGDNYVVTVVLAGGDPATYAVTGGAGTLAGDRFTSAPIPAGQGYSFTATDGNACAPVVLSAAEFDCDCPASSPGAMSATLVSVCGEGDVTVAAVTGAQPDPDDVIGYVLHTGAGNTLGTVLAGPRATPVFAFVAGTTAYGTTYYVSAVVANDDGAGLPDLTDGCRDVAAGTPVRWSRVPVVALAGGGAICPGADATLDFVLTGPGPVTVTYSDGTTTAEVTLATGSNAVTVSPTATTTYTLVSATNGTCAATVSGQAAVEVLDAPAVSNVRVEFSPDFTQYRVTFEITGGDAATYTVDGTALAGATTFTSAFIACGTAYGFVVDDAGGCAPVPVDGNPSCDCRTAVGTLGGRFASCDVTEVASFAYDATAETLDGNDAVQYILYTSDRLAPLLRSATPTFAFQAPMTRGTVYNVAAVAGDAVAGEVDLREACTQFSSPATAVWHIEPTASFTAPPAICAGDDWSVVFTVGGSGAPKTVRYTLGGVAGEVTGVLPGTDRTVALQPQPGDELVLTEVSDANCTVALTQAITVAVATEIVVSNEDDDQCNATNTLYRVSFEITGGDAGSYQVTPAGAGRLTGTAPAVFLSNEIASGDAYRFTVTDASGCFEVEVSGRRDCNCTTEAGRMSTTAVQRICEGEDLVGNYLPGTERLDGNDAVRFVLRRDNDRVDYTDDMIAIGVSPVFAYDPAQMSPGETYYISAVAGDSTVTGLDLGAGCFDIGNATPINIAPLPMATFAGDTVICEGGTAELRIILTGEGPFDVVVENPDGTTSTLPGVSGSDYRYRVDPATGSIYVLRNIVMSGSPQCATDLNSTAAVDVDELVDAGTAAAALELCEGSGDVVELSDRITGADAGGRWTQTGGAPAGVAFDATAGRVRNVGLGAGAYEFTYTIGGGSSSVCPVDAAGVSLVVAPGPDADAGQDRELTCDTPEVELGGAGTQAGATYRWEGGAVGDDAAARTTTREAGTYTLVVTEASLGCEGRDEVVVTADEDLPVIEGVLVRDETCFGDGDGEVTATVSGGTSPLVFQLDDAPATRSPRFAGLAPGEYRVQITDAAGCVVERVIAVAAAKEVVVDAGPSAEVGFGRGHGVRLYLEGAVETVTWTGDSVVCASPAGALCDTVTLHPRVSGNYQVVVRDSNGCIARDALQLIVRRDQPVLVPSAFSPNRDGVNDVVFVQAGEGVLTEVRAFMIFDRWGELMHESRRHVPNDPAFGWDGTFREQEMNPQVFTYWAEVEYVDGTIDIVKGDFALIR